VYITISISAKITVFRYRAFEDKKPGAASVRAQGQKRYPITPENKRHT
jgi:hypothetical protein